MTLPDWTALTEKALTGIVASTVLGALVLARDKVRNLGLRHKIRKSLSIAHFGTGMRGLTTAVHNRAGKPFTVRQVTLLAGRTEHLLNPTGEIHSSVHRKEPKLTNDELARLKRGEAVNIGTKVQFVSRTAAPPVGFVEVKPYTSHTFGLPAEFISHFIGSADAICIQVEYEDWTRETRILDFELRGKAISELGQSIASYRKQYLDGTLNNARKAFHLPPIPLPTPSESNKTVAPPDN